MTGGGGGNDLFEGGAERTSPNIFVHKDMPWSQILTNSFSTLATHLVHGYCTVSPMALLEFSDNVFRFLMGGRGQISVY